MELAIKVMKDSLLERRDDSKPSPNVGAVLVKPIGDSLTVYRIGPCERDHAGYTLLERKCQEQKCDKSILFATLELCTPSANYFPKPVKSEPFFCLYNYEKVIYLILFVRFYISCQWFRA